MPKIVKRNMERLMVLSTALTVASLIFSFIYG